LCSAGGNPSSVVAGIVRGVSGDEPNTEELWLRQLEEERAQLRELEQAQSEADAEKHLRRADKAGYLRQKLEEQQRADRDADA
jgi:hypothetical protein